MAIDGILKSPGAAVEPRGTVNIPIMEMRRIDEEIHHGITAQRAKAATPQ
jgi:hypothetical protein